MTRLTLLTACALAAGCGPASPPSATPDQVGGSTTASTIAETGSHDPLDTVINGVDSGPHDPKNASVYVVGEVSVHGANITNASGIIKRMREPLVACYREQLGRGLKAEGNVSIEIGVDSKGKVTLARVVVPINLTSVRSCFEAVLRSQSFSPPIAGGTATVRATVELDR